MPQPRSTNDPYDRYAPQRRYRKRIKYSQTPQCQRYQRQYFQANYTPAAQRRHHKFVAEFGEDIDRYPALTDREKEILALYYLLDADAELPAKGLSMREVGARLGITKQRVEQIKSNAIKKLRAAKAS